MQPSPHQRKLTQRARLARRLMAGESDESLQTCESRLVLSAQLLTDVVDPMQLQLHGALSPAAPALLLPGTTIDSGDSIAVEPHTAQAHQLSGWNSVQQEFGLKGTGQTVAVIDSGIAWDHVALGKGFGAGYRVVGGWDFAENDGNPYDDGPTGFHGTHVSGIIGSDNAQYPGVASGVDLVGLRVFNDAGQGQIEWVERALVWVHNNRNAFENPITTVNLSLGTTWNASTIPNWATLEEELRQLYEDGIVVSVSAGNAFKQYNAPGLSYPAASPYVLPVASVDDNGNLSDFSQRHDRVLAAPGRNITSTVPDHVLGRDGKINDFSLASGTSMASPYVAGASVLVREAMQMVGISDITPTRIIDWLHNTSDTVYDAITNASYDRLNLQQAIDTLLPDDDVGQSVADAQLINLQQKSLGSWINQLGDQDVFRFTAESSGKLTIDADSGWLESLQWQISSNGQNVASDGLTAHTLQLQAGRSYELRVSAGQEIGPYQLAFGFQADPAGGGGQSNDNGTIGPTTNLGTVDYLSRDVASGSAYHVTAAHDGLFTVQWQNPDNASGSLIVRDASGVLHTDRTWENGMLRLDLNATAGATFDIQLPGAKSDLGSMTLADVVQVRGSELWVRDTSAGDNVQLDLSRNISLDVGKVHYDFAAGSLTRIQVDGTMGADNLSVVSSALADKVDMRPDVFTLENSQLLLTARGMETVSFDSGSGVPDRLYMYDSDGDDTLTARPGSAELTGAGYQFSVRNVDRLFIHATGHGTDLASLYDSAGDDQLSMRPQFTSLQGENTFISIRGFERIYAYATAGGRDTADLYDSAGNDRFSTSGESASLVGPNFNSFTRYFEKVHAHAEAGGHDIATLYGAGGQTTWQRGSDFVSFNEANWNRNAQGFENTSAFINGLAQSIPDASLKALSVEPLDVSEAEPLAETSGKSSDAVGLGGVPMIAPQWQSLGTSGNRAFGLHSSAELLISPQDRISDSMHSNATPEPSSGDMLDLGPVDWRRLADEARAETSAESLAFHANPDSERAILDEIFSRLQ